MQRILRCTFKSFGVLVAVVFMLGVVIVPKAEATCIEVTKFCTDAAGPGEPIEFWGTVTNCHYSVWLYDVKVTDLLDGSILVSGVTLAPGESINYSGSYIPTECPSTNEVMAEGIGNHVEPKTVFASATCDCPENGDGGEGCTPGFWKNHLEAWAAIGYSPDDSFSDIFGIVLLYPNMTLGEAIRQSGKSPKLNGVNVKRLVRHGTAALLNALSGVDYPLSVAEVIASVQAVSEDELDALETANEAGCPF